MNEQSPMFSATAQELTPAEQREAFAERYATAFRDIGSELELESALATIRSLNLKKRNRERLTMAADILERLARRSLECYLCKHKGTVR